MIIPHYINENKSDMRGIKPGWYAIFQPRRMRQENHSADEGADGFEVGTWAELKHFATDIRR